MAGSSNWAILYDATSGQVTRRVWDDAKEITLQHPAAQPSKTEAAILYSATAFQASAQSAVIYGYAVEVDPQIMAAIASGAQISGNAVAAQNATVTASATQAIINATIAQQNAPPVVGNVVA